MAAPTELPSASPFRAAWVTCDAPDCGRIGPLTDQPGLWTLDAQLPPGWRVTQAAQPHADFYIYCPAHAYRYRGRTPQGQRCGPARRSGYHRRASRWVLRSYSTDRRPCGCGAAARELVACWGTHWRRPQPFGHIQPAGCPTWTCGGDLHVGDDSARCLACGYLCFVDYDEP